MRLGFMTLAAMSGNGVRIGIALITLKSWPQRERQRIHKDQPTASIRKNPVFPNEFKKAVLLCAAINTAPGITSAVEAKARPTAELRTLVFVV